MTLVKQHGWPVILVCGRCGDFGILYRSAASAAQGQDPYSAVSTLFVSYYLPAFTLLMRPLTLLPLDTAYDVWLGVQLSLAALALVILYRRFRWPAAMALLSLTPALCLSIVVGQPVPFLLLGLSLALSALAACRWTLAGVFLAIAWLKPSLALPAIGLFVLSRPRLLPGFAIASLVLLSPPPLLSWIHLLVSFPIEHEPLQTSIPGLFPAVLGQHRPGYAAIIALALALSVLALRRPSLAPARRLSWLILIWFDVAPLSHLYDTALLIAPAAVLASTVSVFGLDCWICTALGFYALPLSVFAAPLLALGSLPSTAAFRPRPTNPHTTRESIAGAYRLVRRRVRARTRPNL
jgi:multidrug transporter EmrE-like cation transporter